MNFTKKKKIWSLRAPLENAQADEIISNISAQLNISGVSARLLYNRGYRTPKEAKSFLSVKSSHLHNPLEMLDMDKAVARIAKALENNEKITVYGDYDVDGVTSVTLLYLYLKSLGGEIDYYIPSRSKEGYGLSCMALDNLRESGTNLIITVDTGITANDEVEYAKSLGIEMVITDHHECHDKIPEACAVINPHRPDCPYPFKELAGVGVVFKLVCALEMSMADESLKQEAIDRICEQYIDLVAIGTVADVMPLIDENRFIVHKGLQMISRSERCGLCALIDAANSGNTSSKPVFGEKSAPKKKKITAGYIGFALAPRINAAGRISSAEKAVALLLSQNPDEAEEMAEELCEINLQRQIEENNIAEQAYRTIEEEHDFENDRVIVLENDAWQQGIIGIVASRITEKYGLPSILISFDGATRGYSSLDDVGKGSGRSIKGMNLVEALDYCKDILVRFGGHELAAGLSVMRCNIDEFKKRINDYAREHLNEDLSCIKYEADCELSAEDIEMSFARELEMFEPFGVANPTPNFLIKNLTVDRIMPLGTGKHSKLLLSNGNKRFEAVCFGVSASMLEFYPNEKVDLLCQLNINEFRGQENLQLLVQDIRLSEDAKSEYESEIYRYREICDGAKFDLSEDVIPSRADVAEVYRFFKRENMYGHTSFSLRMLRSVIKEYTKKPINYSKLRFAISILDDINVCEVRDETEGIVSVEVYNNAQKTNIEISETYKKLARQCGA